MRRRTRVALAAGIIVAAVGGAAAAQDMADKGGASIQAIGEATTVYVPIVPCRVVDTRSASATGANRGPFAAGETRQLRVYDGAGYLGQGGLAGACGIAADSLAVEASVTAVDPVGNGFLRAWPTGVPEPNATFLNYQGAENTTNTGAISVSASEALDLTVKNHRSTTHVVIDIQGYYAEVVVG